jgi:hypothetical protein
MQKDKYPFFSDKRLNFFRVCEEEEYTAKVGGEKWQKHKTDKDPWPSDQHAHNYATAEVVDLYTGEVYSTVTGKFVRTLDNGDLAEVRRQVRFVEPKSDADQSTFGV